MHIRNHFKLHILYGSGYLARRSRQRHNVSLHVLYSFVALVFFLIEEKISHGLEWPTSMQLTTTANILRMNGEEKAGIPYGFAVTFNVERCHLVTHFTCVLRLLYRFLFNFYFVQLLCALIPLQCNSQLNAHREREVAINKYS